MTNKEQQTSMYDQPENSDRVEAFDDYIDETTEPIMIAGIKIVPSNALYATDPDAYKSQARWFQATQASVMHIVIETRKDCSVEWHEVSNTTFSSMHDAFTWAEKTIAKSYDYRIISVMLDRLN